MTPAPDTCPDLEEIAAFLDGKLSGAERARIVAHLAECESCYEVFAGAARFQLDEEESLQEKAPAPLPFPRRPILGKKPIPGWYVALAAAILLGLASIPLYRWYFERPPMVSAKLAGSLASRPSLTTHLWTGPTMRGEAEDAAYSRNSFRLGVQLFNLRLSLATGDRASAANSMSRINGFLEHEELVDSPAEFYENTVDPLSRGKIHPGDLLNPAAQREEELDQLILSPYLPFGKWAAAGYLSSVAGEPDFFEDKENRRFLRSLLHDPEEMRLAPEVVNHLRAIQATLRSGNLGGADYQKLRAELAAILKFYDRDV